MEAEDARSISIARTMYEKKVWSVIFLVKFLSVVSLFWSALRDLVPGEGGGTCESNDGDGGGMTDEDRDVSRDSGRDASSCSGVGVGSGAGLSASTFIGDTTSSGSDNTP